MNWTDLLIAEAGMTYKATEGLLDMVDAEKLDWKPTSGENWMTTGQLLAHLNTACGFCCKGFVTGEWDMSEGTDISDMSGEGILPPAEKLPTVASLDEAKTLFAADKALAFEMIKQAGENDLATKMISPPWAPEFTSNLGHHLSQMIQHLAIHKAQLFYYLKLQGKPVDTQALWGM